MRIGKSIRRPCRPCADQRHHGAKSRRVQCRQRRRDPPPELGVKLLRQVKADFDPVAKVEYEPRMKGRRMIMILAPRSRLSRSAAIPRRRRSSSE
jgi:hypothetical protein